MSIIFDENKNGMPFIDGFSVSFSSDDLNKCTVVTLLAESSNEFMPTVTFKTVTNSGSVIYVSPDYNAVSIGGEEKQWRLPPVMFDSVHYTAVFKFRSYTDFKIKNFKTETEIERPSSDGVLFDAHLGFFSAAPQNTLPAFESAGICGYNGCITVPKVTKDGVFVCIHDDTINRTARTDDGGKITEPVYVKDHTYSELLQYDFGINKNPVFKGTRLPLLDDYFKICAKYGMTPIFSIHPDFSDVEWLKIKEMLISHGLLPEIKLKSNSFSILKHTFEIFGNDIGGYIFWERDFKPEYLENLKSIGIDTSVCKGIIEVENKTGANTLGIDIIKSVKDAGFNVSCLSCLPRKTGDYYKEMIGRGAEEFNDNHHCSFGLNW